MTSVMSPNDHQKVHATALHNGHMPKRLWTIIVPFSDWLLQKYNCGLTLNRYSDMKKYLPPFLFSSCFIFVTLACFGSSKNVILDKYNLTEYKMCCLSHDFINRRINVVRLCTTVVNRFFWKAEFTLFDSNLIKARTVDSRNYLITCLTKWSSLRVLKQQHAST